MLARRRQDAGHGVLCGTVNAGLPGVRLVSGAGNGDAPRFEGRQI